MSQQGKPYTPEQRAVIIESLKPFLQLAYSRNKACNFIGLDPTTLSKWVQEDEALSMKLQGWENEISVIARQNWRKEIQEKNDYEASKEWLEKKDRQEFGKNIDVTTDGEKINSAPTVIKWVVQNPNGNGNNQNS
jgi:hypothetical protein